MTPTVFWGGPVKNQCGVMLKISQLLPPGQRPKSKEIFYWFVEAQKDPDTAPLVFWTNGGPGCSGLAGFLTENGPFKVGFDGKNLVHNSHAWNKIANMIFVEQPAGVGFSPAGENPKYSDENSANDNQHFIMKFYERYPALKTHDFYLSSESYGGHYLPTLAKVLVEKGLSDSGWVKPVKPIGPSGYDHPLDPYKGSSLLVAMHLQIEIMSTR